MQVNTEVDFEDANDHGEQRVFKPWGESAEYISKPIPEQQELSLMLLAVEHCELLAEPAQYGGLIACAGNTVDNTERKP